LSSLRVVKAFGQEDREHDRFVQKSGQALRSRIRGALLAGGSDLLSGLVTAAGTATVLTIGVRHVLAGRLTLGSLLLVMAYLSQVYEPLLTISRKARDLQEAFAGAGRALAVLDEAPEVVERPRARPLVQASGRIEFRDVSFSYAADRQALEHVSFVVAPGTRIGIAGPTGAGKTTLMNLLMRFYDPTRGAIFLDGVDLRDYRLADLRNQFAIMLQEPILFSTTIAENIAYGRQDATFDEVVEAARTARAHDFITALPDGYETLVGERGMQLSGGERQRISLARAFLKNAPILVLDEPTSSVDLRTEAAIMESLEHLMRGRTTFMIAHRLSTLEHCDTRLTIENGRIVSFQPPPRNSALVTPNSR
jgi:ATP-binding cassette subfamily B protein